ncbi:hypothetical protein B5180_14105 [Streptomyces sp. BF-3]|nr:hypothetical protein B5180_14105 [Streptomyces sp. BF-3]
MRAGRLQHPERSADHETRQDHGGAGRLSGRGPALTPAGRTVEPARAVPVAREPGSVLARALREIAGQTDVAAALERLPED